MFFVVELAKFKKHVSLVRDDRRKALARQAGPFMRMEASDGRLKLAGLEVAAEMPATVHEPGVLFLKVTLFRLMLAGVKGKTLAIQVNAEGLFLDNVQFHLENAGMLLYPDPATAPRFHPGERLKADELRESRIKALEDQIGLWRGHMAEAEAELARLKSGAASTHDLLFDDLKPAPKKRRRRGQ